MPLSSIQKMLLDSCEIPLELEEFVGKELDNGGLAFSTTGPDFLHILCNLLQITENRLQHLRLLLGRALNINGQQALVAEPSPEITTIEEEIKMIWLRAAALWKATDEVVQNPSQYNVDLSIKHVEYALQKNNLPVVEMIRWARPEFFEISPSLVIIRYLVGFFAGIIGAFLGLVGGFLGGNREAKQSNSNSNLNSNSNPNLNFSSNGKIMKRIFYPLAGIISGSAMGVITGTSFGTQTGYLMAACQLAYDASYLNPFHDPRGAKNYQAVELKREELLFELSHQFSKKKADKITA